MSTFHNLVRGLIVDDGAVLLAQSRGADNTFLPGGHIEFGEGAEDALAREIQEEIGLQVKVGPFIGVIEHIWPENAKENHEFNLVFLAELEDVNSRSVIKSLEPNLEFIWVKISKLKSVNLQPSPLIGLVQNMANGVNGYYWASTLKNNA